MKVDIVQTISSVLEVIKDAENDVPTILCKKLEDARYDLIAVMGKAQRMEIAMQNFIYRVDKGEVRSTVTYATFKAILAGEYE